MTDHARVSELLDALARYRIGDHVTTSVYRIYRGMVGTVKSIHIDVDASTLRVRYSVKFPHRTQANAFMDEHDLERSTDDVSPGAQDPA